jgi:hypothetical protein
MWKRPASVKAKLEQTVMGYAVAPARWPALSERGHARPRSGRATSPRETEVLQQAKIGVDNNQRNTVMQSCGRANLPVSHPVDIRTVSCPQ